ncbi:MAG TPA: FkbM family methyltransferase [Solirubrobacteraceae bacterium]|jgi:FkbM family methyltransferase|nr:FkbM family methyltransferase [Solirubrobacteraceae bacterium]
MPPNLPLRLRIQFAVTRRVTTVLRRLGWREPVIELLLAGRRARRRAFERFGSARYSRPALHQMDRKLNVVIDRDGGFFIEAGGFDGYTQSNTYYLERFRGWRGLLVEPMPDLAAQARMNRTATVFQCALVRAGHPGDSIEMEFGDLMSTIRGLHDDDWTAPGLILGWRDHRTERVPARALSDLLDEVGSPAVDLLSLDVEGYETEALAGLDLSRHAPAWILVEMHDLAQGRAALAPILGDRYVEHDQLSPVDVLYRRRDVNGAGDAAESVRRAQPGARRSRG